MRVSHADGRMPDASPNSAHRVLGASAAYGALVQSGGAREKRRSSRRIPARCRSAHLVSAFSTPLTCSPPPTAHFSGARLYFLIFR